MGARDREHEANIGGPFWDDLRLFMQVARKGSFRAAASAAGQAHNTIARRVAALENHYGKVFLRRSRDGVELTPEGHILQAEVERMQDLLDQLSSNLRRRALDALGEVRVEIEDHLSLAFDTMIGRFRDHEPGIELRVQTAARPADVMRAAIDVAIDLRRPAKGEAIMRRLGAIDFVPAAAAAYAVARPAQAAGQRHTIVEMPSGHDFPSLIEVLNLDDGTPVLRSPGAQAMKSAIVNGAGIGWLPASALAGSGLVRMGHATQTRDVWMTWHPDSGRIERVRRFIDWCAGNMSGMALPA